MASARHPFGRASRVRKRRDFLSAQQTGLRVGTEHFQFVVACGASAASARLGLVVSRKVGGAVERNRVKRLCRECFRHDTWVPPGTDLIVIARPGAGTLDLAAVRTEWARVRRQLQRKAAQALARSTPRGHASDARTPRDG